VKLEKELKRMPHKYGETFVGFFLTPSPTSVPTSVFSFFPRLTVEENVCNTLGLVRFDLLGSLQFVRVDFLESQTKKVTHFQDDCAGVRRDNVVYWKTKRKINNDLQ